MERRRVEGDPGGRSLPGVARSIPTAERDGGDSCGGASLRRARTCGQPSWERNQKRWEEPMSDKHCIFCKLVGGEMESEVVHDEEES